MATSALAAQAERALTDRIRARWRLHAVDDDLANSVDRRILIAGRDLTNMGMEFKSVDDGPLDLNARQYEVLRRSLRPGVPPFVVQFTNPPGNAWCFRLFALRDDGLDLVRHHPCLTLTEAEMEAFTMAAFCGGRWVSVDTAGRRYREILVPNRWAAPCISCSRTVQAGDGILLQPLDRPGPKQVQHQHCREATDPLTLRVARTVIFDAMVDRADVDAYRFGMLHGLDDTLVSETVWPAVTPPRFYGMPELNQLHVADAQQFLAAAGVFDRAERPIELIRRSKLATVTPLVIPNPGTAVLGSRARPLTADEKWEIASRKVAELQAAVGLDDRLTGGRDVWRDRYDR